jgi:integral membrane sensor domain MASE1
LTRQIQAIKEALTLKHLSSLAYGALLVGVYYLGGRLGLYLEAQYGGITPIWVPSGIAVALFLTKGCAYWPIVILGEFSIALTLGQSLTAGVVGGLAQVIEAVLAVRLVSLVNVSRITDSVRSVLWFSLLGTIVPPIIAAIIGSSSLWLLGYLETAAYLPGLITWWLGDAIGILVLAPMLTGLRNWPFHRRATNIYFTTYLAMFGAICWAIIFFGDQRSYYLLFVLVPFVVIAAIHFSLIGAGATILLLSVVVFGMRPDDLAEGDFITAIRMTFVGTCAFTGYLVASFMEKRQDRLTTIKNQNKYMNALHEISLLLYGHLKTEALEER